MHGGTAEQLKAYSVSVVPPKRDWVSLGDGVLFFQVKCFSRPLICRGVRVGVRSPEGGASDDPLCRCCLVRGLHRTCYILSRQRPPVAGTPRIAPRDALSPARGSVSGFRRLAHSGSPIVTSEYELAHTNHTEREHTWHCYSTAETTVPNDKASSY